MSKVLHINPNPEGFLNKLSRLEAFNKLSELEHSLLRGKDINFKEYFALYEQVFQKKEPESVKNNVVMHPASMKLNQVRSLKIQKLKLAIKRLNEDQKDEQDLDLLADIDRQLDLLDIKIDHLNRKWGMK